MLGNFADDDPEGPDVYQKVLKAAQEVPEVHIITDLTDMVSPFQSLSKVVVQKSLKEGFGLTVTEALWKGTPVVGGNVGGIRLQIGNGVGGYLVDSVQECTERVDQLLTDEEQRQTLGRLGQEHVRSNFLLPRLLRDELRVMKRLLSSDGLASDCEDADVAEGDAVR
jgi:trehalose synthase